MRLPWYILDFLGLKNTYSEKDLENAILAELESFILDGKDYYIDLLFYHRTLHRLRHRTETWRV